MYYKLNRHRCEWNHNMNDNRIRSRKDTERTRTIFVQYLNTNTLTDTWTEIYCYRLCTTVVSKQLLECMSVSAFGCKDKPGQREMCQDICTKDARDAGD